MSKFANLIFITFSAISAYPLTCTGINMTGGNPGRTLPHAPRFYLLNSGRRVLQPFFESWCHCVKILFTKNKRRAPKRGCAPPKRNRPNNNHYIEVSIRAPRAGSDCPARARIKVLLRRNSIRAKSRTIVRVGADRRRVVGGRSLLFSL